MDLFVRKDSFLLRMIEEFLVPPHALSSRTKNLNFSS